MKVYGNYISNNKQLKIVIVELLRFQVLPQVFWTLWRMPHTNVRYAAYNMNGKLYNTTMHA